MKTTLLKKLAIVCFSLLTASSWAQCINYTGLQVNNLPNGMASITAVTTATAIPATAYLNWNTNGGTIVSSGLNSVNLQFPSNGTYSVCVYYGDSTLSCTPWTSCTTVTITNITSGQCNAGFSFYQDSICNTHFINSTTGSSLTYQWFNNGNLFSTNTNPILSIPNGTGNVMLLVSSAGSICDSIIQTYSLTCNPSTVTAQCINYTGLQVNYNNLPNGMASITAITTATAIPATAYLNWNINGATIVGSGLNSVNLQFPANGTYSVCVFYSDSTLSCTPWTSCTTVTITNLISTPCAAGFTFYQDSSCNTHFINSTTGSALTYQWFNNGNLFSTNTNPTLNIPNGTGNVMLLVSSAGSICDSIIQTYTLSCTANANCYVNSQFSIFADTVNIGNYFAYNQSSGSGNLSYLWNFGDGSTSTQPYPFHQYATPGQYIVCLTTTSTSGSLTCTDMFCDSSSVHRIASGFLMKNLQVMAQSPTGLQNKAVSANLSIYPNPIENELTIEVQSEDKQTLSVILTDALGKIVLKQELTAPKTTLNTSEVDKGIYFLSVMDNNHTIIKTTKLVK